MIPHRDFARLRLADFAARPEEVVALENREYRERLWRGEVAGFTGWLRPVEEPDFLGVLSSHVAVAADG